jgi:hypothetical protein
MTPQLALESGAGRTMAEGRFKALSVETGMDG